MTSKEWITETVSVWRQKGLGPGHPDAAIEKLHPAPFSFTDVSRLIRFFTKPGQQVLDPFVGIGSTLKAAALEGRSGVGIELNAGFVELARQRLLTEVGSNLSEANSQVIMEGDARTVLVSLPADTFSLLVTSPPYWNILHKRDHKVRQERESKKLRTRYSQDDPRDLGNLADYSIFVEELVGIFREAKRTVRPGGHAAIIVSDFRHGSRLYMFHADVAQKMEADGWQLKGITVLYQSHKRVFPYGYPTSYVPNIHHQYILILQKPKEKSNVKVD